MTKKEERNLFYVNIGISIVLTILANVAIYALFF